MDIILASETPPQSRLCENLDSINAKLVTPGEIISEDSNFMRGHGTYIEDGKLIASVAGYLMRVNRLLTVTPLRQVYQGAVGDTVVGRITQVQNNRWKVDVNSRLDADLRLSNIQLPGGEQRRTDIEDERGMRSLLKEGDLICVEAQKITDDGIIKLTARTAKFGKLSQGILIKVSPSLIVQDKQRMHNLPCGARVIFAANGYVFVTPTPPTDHSTSYIEVYEEIPLEVRQTMARLNNVIKLLAYYSIMVSPTSVMTAYGISMEKEYEVKDLLKPEVRADLALLTVHQLND